MLTRRSLIGFGLTASLAPGLSGASQQTRPESSLFELKLRPEPPTPIPVDFTGLGYEMSAVATPGLFSVDNGVLLQLLEGLGAKGVIRVGGIVADYTRFEADGPSVALPKNTVISRADLERFHAFLERTGWTAIWSLNFAQGSLADAVSEAQNVATILGPRLQALELGNEVENYGRGSRAFRKPPYAYEDYRREYEMWRAAIVRTLPAARFAAPDTASDISWVVRMSQEAKGDVQLLTTHYYRNGQRQGSLEQLLNSDSSLIEKLAALKAASQASGIPWRMCEANSFSGGGLPGVSDSFTGALWTLDFMLLHAVSGCAGVNIETGINQLGFLSSYSPVRWSEKEGCSPGNSYYGMLAFAVARHECSHAIPIEAPIRKLGVTAYALGVADRVRSVVAINRSNVEVDVSVKGLGLPHPHVMRLVAPSLNSKEDIRLAGSSVEAGGRWSPEHAKDSHSERNDGGTIRVPAYSAAIIRD